MHTPTKSFSTSRSKLHFTRIPKRVMIAKFQMLTGVILLCATTFACRQKTTSFDTFDPYLWISETKVCENYRNNVIEDMEAEFDKFIGMSETEVIKYLGNPDKTLLYTRGQKFFSYKIDCKDSLLISSQLRIRFSALDVVNEVLILN